MLNYILIITDNLPRSDKLVKEVGTRFQTYSVDLSGIPDAINDDTLLLVIDVDLNDPDVVAQLKNRLASPESSKPRIFITKSSGRREIVQAQALGASAILTHPCKGDELQDVLELYARRATMQKIPFASEQEKEAFEGIESLNDTISDAILSAKPLPKEQVHKCTDMVVAALEEKDLSSWLEAVKQHHSYTYRHSMCVTGLAVAFGLHFGMRHTDIRRLSTGALLHDIGKIRIPVDILDKSTPLTPKEEVQLRQHPVYSGMILTKDGQFEHQVIDVAVHHHECLDGTGYPDGLKGNEISDLVRVFSVIDTFSALTDRRAYKKAIPGKEAYRIMLSMEGKLDINFLKAFKPIALSTPSMSDTELLQKIASDAA